MKSETNSGTRTTETVTISHAEYEEFKAQNPWLMEQMRLIRKKQFGVSSEKASEETLEQLSLLLNEAEVYASEEQKEEVAPAPAIEVRPHTRKKSDSVHIVPADIRSM